MQNEGWSTLTQEFNQGASISRSEPSDIRQLWEASSRIPGEERWQSQRAMGFGAFGCGIDPSSRSPEQLFAITIRLQLLSALLRRGVLDDYMQDDESRNRVFRAIATLPCSKDDLAQAMIPVKLSEFAPEVVAKTKDEMRAQGYDPDHPAVDDKFLAWMRKA